MAAKDILQIIIQAIDNASKPLNKIQKATQQLSKETVGARKTFKGFGKGIAIAMAAIATFGVVAKKAFDMGKAGAAVKQTGQSFEFLTKKVGASADLLDQLRTASKGTIPDLQLMSSTATLLAGAQGDLATELAQSTPQLLKIAKAAQKLNPALGDTTFLYDSLATGVKRASPMILDNLGLTIRIGAANEAFAKTLGKTVEALTADEQKQALLNETLRAGAVLIEQAGDTTESATDSYNILEAGIGNLTDSIKMNIHTAIEPWVKKVSEAVDDTQDWVDGLGKISEEQAIAAEMTRIGADEVATYSGNLATATGVVKDYNEAQELLREQAIKNVFAMQAHINLIAEDIMMQAQEADWYTKITPLIEATVEATEELIDADKRLAEIKGLLRINMGEASEEMVFYQKMLDEATARVLELGLAEGDVSEEIDLMLGIVERANLGLEAATTRFEESGKAALDSAADVDVLTKSYKGLVFWSNQGLSAFNKETAALAANAAAYDDAAGSNMYATEALLTHNMAQNKALLLLGDMTRAEYDLHQQAEELNEQIDNSTFANVDYYVALEEVNKQLDALAEAKREEAKATDENTGSLAANDIERERSIQLKNLEQLALGKTTQELINETATLNTMKEAYIDMENPTLEFIASLAAQVILVDVLQEEQRGLQKTLGDTATSYNQVAAAAAAALAAQGARIEEGLGIVSEGGDIRAAKIGAEWEMVHGEWRSGAGGRNQAEHAWDVIEDMKKRHSFDPSNPDKAALEFLYSAAGGGGTSFVDKLAVEAAMQAQKEGKGKEGLRAQHGANFMVPPGFNNDNFMLGVSSGEHVSVTPAHSSRGGGGGISIQNLTVSGVQTDSQLFEAVVRAARQRGRDFARVM